ncbi:dipeptidase [Nocardioides marmoribigeumensis]|uniref:Acetylornithine deacetylase/succinyl-diaminopimelate desuccinylase-like protein n=1 Tax=Nocardioides marmoribigeumensis TaxID=433649 RepID=A0ABU2BWK2_9ACTN|nr:dipeptidase [Nocardioides marmoribigeumensis]MDR7362801.1 acetylornithine deacetylase/succinyl-diaminopimelate desuccinylase-like protein [Nocardioides marmoribigeumensis]
MDLHARLDAVLPSVRADLEDLVRIPSVGALPAHADDVRRSAEATARLLEGAGLAVEVLSVEGGAPAVLGTRPAPEGAPTVLLYAHHDVQPVGEETEWTSAPFEPTERGGRLFGRGAADDKAGIAVHLAALRAWGDDLPVGVTVLVEGEEEEGSPTLEAFLETYRDRLAADVIVIADSTNWEVGVPALTTSLRGLAGCDIEVSTLEHGVHSGMFGGPVPDALTTLCRLLATLHDEAGEVAVEGLHAGPASDLDYPEDRFRAEASALEGVELIGSGSIVERLWTRPTVNVIGIDAPSVAECSNTLVPRARAAISLRVAPGQDAKEALGRLLDHLERHVPWGARLEVLATDTGSPTAIDATGPAYDAAREAFAEAWDGTEPVDIGVGGSIPFIAAFREAFPEASVLVTGVEDPDTRAHSTDEGLHLGEFRRACLAETLLLRNLTR